MTISDLEGNGQGSMADGQMGEGRSGSADVLIVYGALQEAESMLVPTSLSQHNIFLAGRCGRFLWSTQMERHARCMRR